MGIASIPAPWELPASLQHGQISSSVLSGGCQCSGDAAGDKEGWMLPEQEVREDDAAIHLPPRSPFSGSPPGEQ